MSAAAFAIGVDLGGTNLRAGAVDASGAVLCRRSVPVGADKSAASVVRLVAAEVRAIADELAGTPAAIGCGIPGIVDAAGGIVQASPHFPLWNEEPMRERISAALSLPVTIDNDANCHALGEARCGAGRWHRNVICLTLGTGIGGGLILDGELFRGDRGYAGEVGHIVVEPEGEPCGCGGRGCLEQYAASHGFSVFARRLPEAQRTALVAAAGAPEGELTPEIMARLADEGNAVAQELWEEWGRYLGVGIATLVNTLGVMTFVIGGGIVRSWDKFIGAARASALSHTYPRHASELVFLKAELGDDAGIVGAALLERSSSIMAGRRIP
jgi:glucokinase